jgi:carboxymethylenebutenolidase
MEGKIMAIKGEWINYGDQKGYFAAPQNVSEPLPAIIVIQEIWGVNEHIEDVTRRLASAGYAALAPDLFVNGGERPEALSAYRIKKTMKFMAKIPPAAWRDAEVRNAELAKLNEIDRVEIGETIGHLFTDMGHREQFIPKLKDAVNHLRTVQPETKDQKVACVGFCMGGGLSALLACEEPELSGAAVFYGSTPPQEKISSVHCPVIAFYGGNDQRINAGIPLFENAMHDRGKSFERFIYDGANHSFFNDDGQAYNVKAVRDSYVHLIHFFYDVLAK